MGDTRINYVRTDAVPGGVKKPADRHERGERTNPLRPPASALGIRVPWSSIPGALSSLSLNCSARQAHGDRGYRGGADICLGDAAGRD